jgi:hypothetical protein
VLELLKITALLEKIGAMNVTVFLSRNILSVACADSAAAVGLSALHLAIGAARLLICVEIETLRSAGAKPVSSGKAKL